jgi:anaerobic selenocysteine-containing dehydrogenase
MAIGDFEGTTPPFLPEEFFNGRLEGWGVLESFPRPLPARERKWSTPNGKANFTCPETLSELGKEAADIYRLMTIRSDGQFNTTIYTKDDRFRGVYGGRLVVLMNANDMAELGLMVGAKITISTVADDNIQRTLSGCWLFPTAYRRVASRAITPNVIPLSRFGTMQTRAKFPQPNLSRFEF